MKHTHWHYFIKRTLSGSIGAEIWSSLTWALLSVMFVFQPPPPLGIVLTLLGGPYAKVFLPLIFILTVIHIVELLNAPSRRSIIIRKTASALEGAAWTEICANLVYAHQLGTVILIFPLLVLLYVAVARRTYSTWGILA